MLGFDGVRVIDAMEDSVQSRTDKSSDLWSAGQNVLTELRICMFGIGAGDVDQLKGTPHLVEV